MVYFSRHGKFGLEVLVSVLTAVFIKEITIIYIYIEISYSVACFSTLPCLEYKRHCPALSTITTISLSILHLDIMEKVFEDKMFSIVHGLVVFFYQEIYPGSTSVVFHSHAHFTELLNRFHSVHSVILS